VSDKYGNRNDLFDEMETILSDLPQKDVQMLISGISMVPLRIVILPVLGKENWFAVEKTISLYSQGGESRVSTTASKPRIVPVTLKHPTACEHRRITVRGDSLFVSKQSEKHEPEGSSLIVSSPELECEAVYLKISEIPVFIDKRP
jgi:hypothetical protein